MCPKLSTTKLCTAWAAIFLLLAYLAITSLTRIASAQIQKKETTLQELKPNQPVRRALGGGEKHQYKVMLKAGRFFQVYVEQQGVDVLLRLLDANSVELARMDSPNNDKEVETLTFVATKSGSYTLEVSSFKPEAVKGNYMIRRESSRIATLRDKRRVEVEAVFAKGMAAKGVERLTDTAIKNMEEALRGWQELRDSYMTELTTRQIRRDKNGRAKAMFELATKLADQGTLKARQASLPILAEARRITHEINEKKGEAICLSMLGKVNYDLSDMRKAFDYYDQALPLWRAITDKEREAGILKELGVISLNLKEKQKALEYFQQALPLFKALPNKQGEATILNDIGTTYSALGEKKKALEYMNQALPLYRDARDRYGEATALTNIGIVYADLGKKHESLAYYLQALPIYRAIPNKQGEANTLRGIGNIYSALEEKQKAIEPYLQASLLFQALKDERSAAELLDTIGFIYIALGDKPKAIEYLLQALTLYRAIPNKEEQAHTLSNLASISGDLGEKQKALEYDKEALSLYRDIQDEKGEAIALNNIGMVYLALGENQKARDEYFEKGLPLFKKLQDKRGEAWTHMCIGAVYVSTGEHQGALEHFKQALTLYKEARDKRGETNALVNLGLTYERLRDEQKALESYMQGLKLDETYTAALINIGSFYNGTREKQKALEYSTRALLFSIADGKDAEAAALANLRSVWQFMGNTHLAIFYGKESVNKYQELRQTVRGLDNEIQRSFLRRVDFAYRDLAELLIKEGQLAEAVQVLNLYQDQQYFDFNRDHSGPVKHLSRSSREADLVSRYEQLSEKVGRVGIQIKAWKYRIGDDQPDQDEAAQLSALETEFKTASDAFLAFLKNVEAEFSRPPDARDGVHTATDVTKMQKALREISKATKQKTVAIYTLTGGKNVHVILVMPDGIKGASPENAVKASELNEKILQFYAVLQHADLDPRPLGKKLYDIIFKPIEKELPRKDATLLWSLDGNLRYVPMAALYDGKHYLVERYNHAVFTRADSDRLTPAVSASWTGLGLGSSSAHIVENLGEKIRFDALPGVKAELRAVFKQEQNSAGLLDGKVLQDDQFTKDTMLKALQQKRPLVHIASHFRFHPGSDFSSFLVLGNSRALTLNEMKRTQDLFSGVELLTLSACETAAQLPDATGREIDGFAELAQRLGAGAVMATLWKVADNSTPWLMRDFYAKRQNRRGMSKSAALRKSQLALLNGTAQAQPLPPTDDDRSAAVSIVIVSTQNQAPRRDNTRADMVRVADADAPPYKRDEKKPFAHPYYWAPFVLFGNSR